MKKPDHLFKPMSAEQVERLWTRLYEETDKREARMKLMTTTDGQGIRWMCYTEFNALGHEKDALEKARYILVEVLTDNR